METHYPSPFAQLELQRLPHSRQGSLRAWDAADELLLEELAEAPAEAPVLVLNDSFGALTLNLATLGLKPQLETDSWLSARGAQRNGELNGIDADRWSLATPLSPLQGTYATVLVKIPKTLSLLEYQLRRLRPHLNADSRIIGAGMARNIHRSTLQLFEQLVGPTRSSLARKKARLVFAEPAERPLPEAPPPPGYRLPEEKLVITNFANLFSLDQLDIGSRFFLPHIPAGEHPLQIADLGCGNGLLGLVAARRNPAARLLFRDESALAVACAEHNWRHNRGDDPRARFEQGDCLQGVEPASLDLILCNPPFHQQHAVGDQIAQRMFRQAHRSLRVGGELRIVGNRHLGYHQQLKRLFGNCRPLDSNPKFVVLSARRQ
ncbi:methyltransferase [Aestuariirhabdus litorea]|uniref:Ribosomal RNA large subunit methyltransferase G n=1 Tax=Aestuariirhabdus litorea TaxID=2528527 RepID=A0A3P3VNF5_9GAMM|nr:methyltransferase [Aestuariirhabdus litorea]RRJ83239.1 methyltransferase domain-containing protein [Aestuariirhabdus litorea]RWW93396.1 methyltransferase domain-containing protein [Endozoicomonadaceae bacterium GTF-13]